MNPFDEFDKILAEMRAINDDLRQMIRSTDSLLRRLSPPSHEFRLVRSHEGRTRVPAPNR